MNRRAAWIRFQEITPFITYLFIGFALMTFLPGYPILCGAFFVCIGIFQGYPINKDSNDIMYSILLPVSKSQVVKAKYLTVAILQMSAFVLCLLFTLIRMTLFSNTAVYENNALMPVNFVYLAFVLLIFACFNMIFVGDFFKTAYGIGKPFILFIVANFIIIIAVEVLHYVPGFEWMNAMDFRFMTKQVISFIGALGIYIVFTVMSCRTSCMRFQKIDL